MGLLELELICAQKHPEFIDECIALLNSEWPRSKTARLVAIQQGSSEGFPTTLLLIDKNKSCLECGVVVAHCKVSPVSVYHPEACFVESVVVSKHLRGKGIGRIIMDKMENYVKCRGIRTIFLTTHDQQGFYEKMGYSLCDPVVIYGGKCGTTFGSKMPFTPSSSSQNGPKNTKDPKLHNQKIADADDLSRSLKTISLNSGKVVTTDVNNATNMPPPPGPPPPPPPLPLPVSKISSPKKLTKDDIILRPDLVKVTMRKDLFY